VITEFVLAGLGYYSYHKIKNFKVKNIFKMINEDNKLGYNIIDVRKTVYGYILEVSLNSQGFKDLESKKDIFQTAYGAYIDIQQNTNLKTASVYVITEQLIDTFPFTPVKVQPWELYLGKTYTMKDVIVSMKDLPHVLYSGINSSGKTYCVVTALLNLSIFNTKRDIEIYLAQISAKKDLRKFKDLKQCRGYAETLEEAYSMFQYLYHVMLKRIGLFNAVKDTYIDTIYEWNKTFPKRKMRVIYLSMDEFTAYMPDSLDNEKEAAIKQKCLDLLIKLIQQCRCAGIYIIACLQRPDKESFPPRLKAQFNCKVSFKQPNIASSLVVVDSEKAFYVKPKREAIVNADQEYLMKTLYLDNEMILDFLKENLDLEHTNYYDLEKQGKEKPQKSKGRVKIDNAKG